MGKNELEHLRKEAEQAIADAARWPANAGWAAVAKTLMYVGELLADRLEGLEQPVVHGNPDIWGDALKLFRPSEERWDCSYCDKQFDSEGSLSTHVCEAAIT